MQQSKIASVCDQLSLFGFVVKRNTFIAGLNSMAGSTASTVLFSMCLHEFASAASTGYQQYAGVSKSALLWYKFG